MKEKTVKKGFTIEYTVDLDNEDMVLHAKDAIAEDIDNAVKMDEVFESIQVVHDKEAKESNIPEFLGGSVFSPLEEEEDG